MPRMRRAAISLMMAIFRDIYHLYRLAFKRREFLMMQAFDDLCSFPRADNEATYTKCIRRILISLRAAWYYSPIISLPLRISWGCRHITDAVAIILDDELEAWFTARPLPSSKPGARHTHGLLMPEQLLRKRNTANYRAEYAQSHFSRAISLSRHANINFTGWADILNESLFV